MGLDSDRRLNIAKEPLPIADDPSATAHYAARGWFKSIKQKGYVMPVLQRDEHGVPYVELSNHSIVRLPNLRASR